MLKQSPIRSKKIRNAAKGEQCTIQFLGICNNNPETTVLAHIHDEQFGMAQKADDTSACFACSSCHSALDTHQHGLSEADLFKTLLRALQRTVRRLVQNGVMIVQQDQAPRPKAHKTRVSKENRVKIKGRMVNSSKTNARDIND